MIVEYGYLLLSAVRLNAARRRYLHKHNERTAVKKAAEEAACARYASWLCPDCGMTFGSTVQYVNYGIDNVINTARGPFTRHVIITCRYCKLLNVFDPQGAPMFARGEDVPDRVATWIDAD